MRLSLFRKSVVLLVTTIIANAVPFVVALILVRSYSVDEFGYLTWLLSSYAVFTIIFDFGYSNSMLPKIINFKFKERYIRNFIINSLIVKLLLAILLSIVCSFYDQNLIIIVSSVFLYSVIPAFLFLGIEKYLMMFLVVVIPKILFLMLVVFVGKSNVDVIINSLFLSSLVSLLLGVVLVRRSGISFYSITFRKRHFRYFLKINKGFFMSRTSLSIYQQGGGFVLGFLSSSTVVGYYFIAEQIYKIALTLLYPVSQALYATVVKEKNVHIYMKFVVVLFSLSLAGSLIVVIFMNAFGGMIYGSVWASSNGVLIVLMVVFAIHSMTLFVGYPLYNILGKRNFNFVNYSSFIALAVFVIYVFICKVIGEVDAVNIALAVLVSEIVSLLIRVYGIFYAE